MKQKISIVIPIYNEEDNLVLIYSTVTEILQTVSEHYDYELILVNDGSKDSSWSIITQLAFNDPCIKALNFSRNFGHQMALTAGYDIASGDAIISIDADLQDPPHLILDMIKAWQQGSAIVYARRINRQDSFLKKFTAIIYYRFLDYVSDIKIPRNVGDYRLIDKKVLQTIQECREKSRYLRGMVAWTGFKHTFIDFNRPNRHAGKTGYTWSKMFKLAFDGLTGFSLFPLKIAAFVGIFVIATGLLMFSYISLDALLFGVNYPLFKWLVTIIYIFMGLQFILLWLIGEYIGRIHEQQKNRPLYIVDRMINFTEKSSNQSTITVPNHTTVPVNDINC
jgi:polyisoprenyl-phosphate glycosyltransferase